jgi:hypothetical protein
MKKIFNILILLFAVVIANAQQQPAGCCPKFELATSFIYPCDGNACKTTDAGGAGNPSNGQSSLIACKNQQQTYYVVPNLAGFSYNWTLIGGTIVNPNANPGIINWGGASQAVFQVIIKNADSTCRDTITRKVCLIDGPTASITYNPNPVCTGAAVNFSGAGSVGATNYYWNFGDGTSSTLQNPPPHVYNSSGLKTIILTVSSTVTDSSGNTRDCGCKDTAMVVVNVSPLAGINIYTDDCRKMLCTGDTVKYCTSTTGCSLLTWSVNGGTIISGQGTSCATVVWNQPSVYPASVTLTANCPGTCGNTATLNVPVLYPNLPIQGPLNVCAGSNTAYSLPALPGTFYYWTLSGGGSIVGYDSNHNVINVTWGSLSGGPYKLICRYTNPYSGCSGADTIDIYIKPKFTLAGLPLACVGQTTGICANGPVATWAYLPSLGFTVMSSPGNCKNIKWNVAGSYAITATPVTPGNYCSSPALINVVVLDTPKINPITGSLLVCPGQNVMYAVTSNMNAGTFNWTVTNGTIIQQMGSHKDSVLVQFTGSGTISVSQTVNGCSSYTQVINVGVITSIGTITGASPTCIDAVETYTIAGPVPPGGYNWTLSNALGAIITTTPNSITVQWNGAGASSTCTITATACSQTATKVVTVNNPPNGTITATGDLCNGGVTLTTSLAMPSHDWYKNGVFYTNSGAGTSINVTTPGFYKVKSPTPCYGTASINVPNTFTSSVSITADNVTVFCPGDPINVNLIATVQANNTCTYSYQWYNGITPVGTNSPTYNVTVLGSYTVVISCGNCKDTSNIISVTQGPCDGPCGINFNPFKEIGNDIGGPSSEIIAEETEAVLSYNININTPVASPCNVVTFDANYNFTAPNSPHSGVFWNFGDGYGSTSSWAGMSGTSTAAPHTYTTPGIYIISALMYSNCPAPPTPHICPVLDTIQYIVPVAANFGYNVNCNTITLSDLSSTLPSLGCNISTWAWSVGGPAGATFNNNAAQNPVLTVTQSGTYNITLLVTSNCGGCQATITLPVIINVPSATFTPPTPICALTAAPFAVPASTGFSYNWNFGDGYQSNAASTNHAFASPPPSTSVVTLTVTNLLGCAATSSQTVTILPALNVTIPTDKFICPGGSFTLATTPAVFTNYQWYFNGNPITGATNATYNASTIGEYYVMVNNGVGCAAKSNKMHIWQHPKPIANIQGQSIACITGGTGYINLQNSVNDPNSTYSWSVNPAVTLTPANQYYTSATVNTTGTYQFILTVTDNITGCIAKDTFCVYVYNSPTVSIAPTGYLCEGIMHTYTATALPANPNYVYQWNNGATGVTMATAQAGNYYVTVLDPATGCNAQSNMATIKKRPYTALFPIGCDTLCDTAKIIPPLPLTTGQNYNGVYVIKWYVDGVYNSTGPVLNLNALTLGLHQINIVVNFIGDTCAATSGIYSVLIKHCGDCDCKESHWGQIQLSEGEKALNNNKTSTPGKQKTKANAANEKNAAVIIGNPIILQCKKGQKLDCNKTYTINASYICKDSACNGKVTYSLQTGVGGPITGNAPLTFTTPAISTVYTLTLYGWCGGKICDSCVIDLIVECAKNCCKESYWKNPPAYYFEGGGKPVVTKIDCNKETVINIAGDLCKVPLIVTSGISCPVNCTGKDSVFVYDNLNNIVLSGPAPLSIIGLVNGAYTIVINGYCDGHLCLSCKLILKVNCIEKECDCKGSHWGEKTYSINNITRPIKCFTTNDKPIDVKCNAPVTVNANYICADEACNGAVTYTLTQPGGTTSGNAPLTFTPGLTGVYTVTLYGWCGNKICDSCTVKFKASCDSVPCCPYEIKAEPKQPTYTSLPNATIISNSFAISIPAIANITEVRANVVSYTIDDNYKKECMKCVNLPFTWASVSTATNINAAPPKITMYGGATVSSFNGSGAGAYQNPREVIWNNGTNLNNPGINNIGMSFILPATPAIDCCELKGTICVKFTFRDNDCKECEVIACFNFLIKKK